MSEIKLPSARELSQEEAEQRAERCFALDQEIKAGLRAGREAVWRVAAAMHEFDEESGWTALGYDKLGDWLADPEVSTNRRTFFRMTSVYRDLAVQRQLPAASLAELDIAKVDIVLGKVKAGAVKLDDALEDVVALGAQDLRRKYIGREDPANQQMPADDTPLPPPVDDDEEFVPPPQNPTDDTPRWASEEVEVVVEKPAHNGPAHSGQVSVVMARAKEALALPQRTGPQRRLDMEAVRAVRGALEALIASLDGDVDDD